MHHLTLTNGQLVLWKMSLWAKCAPKTVVFLIAVSAGRTGVMIALPVVNYKGRQRPSVLGILGKNVPIRLSALHLFILSHCSAVKNHTRIN